MTSNDQDQNDETRLDTQVEPDLVAARWLGEDDLPELDRFKLLRKLGEGGMGQVFLARQTEPVERQVALKLIRVRVQNATNLARFEVERQALAQMNHPAIAQVFDAGTTAAGQPWFAMEYVDGQRLDAYCRERQMTLNERLDLFVRICNGVQHAHQRGIIHRDLKPANILIRELDGQPLPKIIDFGIATASAEAENAGESERDVVGTPQYMSPEQFQLGRHAIDYRSDVYALGVILYELLTDCLPIDDPGAKTADSEQMREILARQTTLPVPSERISTAPDFARIVAARRRTQPRRLARRLRGDLDAITLKALAGDPEQRYASAQDLATDIGRARQFQPVSAMPDSASYRLRRFARRHALGLGSASAVLLALLAGLTAAMIGMFEAQRQFEIAEQRQQELSQVARFQQAMLADLDIQAMGIGLIDGFRTQVDQDAELAGLLDSLISRLNAPDLARGLVDEFILERARVSIEADFGDQPSLQADLLKTVFDIHRSMGSRRGIEALARRILELREATRPAGDLQIFKARYDLASAQYSLSDYPASIATYEALLEDIPELDDEHLALRHQATQGLATSLIDSQHGERALKLAEESSAQSAARWGDDDERTLAALSNLGYVRIRSGDIPGALEIFQRLVDGRRGQVDENDQSLIGPMINLGGILGASGRHEEALANDDQAFEILARNRGLRHPHTLRVMNNRAAHKIHLGQVDEAVALLEQALELRRTTVGASHPETLRTQLNLASALLRLGEYERAHRMLSHVHQERLALLGEMHGDTLMAAELLSDALIRLERYPEALELIEPVHQLRLERLGEEHRLTIAAAWYYGRALLELDRTEQAAELLGSAARHSWQSEPPDHPPLLRRSLDYYRALLRLGRQAEAAELRTTWLTPLESDQPEHREENLRQLREELLAVSPE